MSLFYIQSNFIIVLPIIDKKRMLTRDILKETQNWKYSANEAIQYLYKNRKKHCKNMEDSDKTIQ